MKINEKCLALYSTSGKKPDKEGYLLKRGDVNKSFQKRWCVIKGNFMFYFDKRTDKEPIGFLVLEECVIELAENTDAFVFLVKYPGESRTYTFCAETQEEMEAWMRALSSCGYEYVKLVAVELQRRLEECITSESRGERQDDELGAVGGRGRDNPGACPGVEVTKRFNPFDKGRLSPACRTDWHVSGLADESSDEKLPERATVRSLTENISPCFNTSQFREMHRSFGAPIQDSIHGDSVVSDLISLSI